MLFVLVSGSRHLSSDSDKKIIRDEIQSINPTDLGFSSVCLVHGGCSGVDKYCGEIAHTLGWTVQVFTADWFMGRKAGPIRNQQMIDTIHPHIILAFPRSDSVGTYDCIRRSREYERSAISRLIYMKEIQLE